MAEVVSATRALKHLMDLLSIEGLSGREDKVAETVRQKLLEAGCRRSWMQHDRAHKKIGNDFEIGNLIVKLPGKRREPRRLFSGHLDTVPLCRGAVPVRRGRRIYARGKTALGGDNRTAVACLVSLVETLLKKNLSHPPLTLLFTVGEEVGLQGARHVTLSSLGNPRLGFNIDSGTPADFIVGAVGADRWEAEILGISSHAGVHPEHGVSATLIASRAIAEVSAKGFFGQVRKGKERGTSNVGRIEGGEASNQVTDHVLVRGECRSHRAKFIDRVTAAYRQAFERAARSVKNHKRRSGAVRFQVRRDYEPFSLARSSPVVRIASRAARQVGLSPSLVVVDGGLDANWLNAKGLATVTLGAGQHGAHTLGEYVEVQEYIDGCRLAVELATQPGE